jgi:hypothetical protein
VLIGSGWLEFCSEKEGNIRINISDMKEISLTDGGFKFIHKDTKWWSAQGKFYFNYSSIGNAKAFILCMQDIAMSTDKLSSIAPITTRSSNA